GRLTSKVHDYRMQKIQHIKIFARDSFIYYKKRRYVCRDNECSKRFYESNAFIEKFQRQSKELKQAIAFDVIHAKSFKDVALRFNTSIRTVVRRFDQITSSMLSQKKPLPKVIAIDEYKGDAGGEKFQTIIVDPINRIPLDILPDRKKETVKEYLQTYGQNVNVVVMDMSHSFKSEVDQALGKPVIVADRFHFSRYIYWALERVRRKEQNNFHEYDRKKCKRMRHVFYKRNENLTENQRWYLERYLNMSDYLRKAYELKEAYCKWFDEAKLLTETKNIVSIKENLYVFYEKVKCSGVDEFMKAIQTFKNWQLEILNSFAYNLHNGFI